MKPNIPSQRQNGLFIKEIKISLDNWSYFQGTVNVYLNHISAQLLQVRHDHFQQLKS